MIRPTRTPLAMDKPLIVFCTCPSLDVATAIADRLVEARLAACVNILPGITSVYRWQDQVQRDAEVLLLIKTAAAAYPALEASLRAQHPYELPEVVAVPIETGSTGYLQWLHDVTTSL